MKKNDVIKLLIAVFVTVSLGTLGGLFTVSEISGWYALLQKPSFNPPNWIFAPVWTVLYTMMGISVFLIWRMPASRPQNSALQIFILQFGINFCWSLIFFRLHQTGWALVEILILWCFILLTIIRFGPLSRPAAWLLVPYIAWVSFATILNAAIWWLNR